MNNPLGVSHSKGKHGTTQGITASVGVGLIACSFVSKKKKHEEETITLEKDIFEDTGIDKIVIVVDGTDVILSVRAEEYMRRLLNKREKSSLLYT